MYWRCRSSERGDSKGSRALLLPGWRAGIFKWGHVVCAGVVLLLASAFGSVWAAEGYQLGAGKNVGPLNIAGYSNLEADMPRRDSYKATLDLSLLLSAHVNRYLNPFLEAEADDWTLAQESGGASSGTGVIERLYDDLDITPAVTLRLGKMLTPVGEWNLIHAPPLVWTVTRPLSTYYSFPEFITGASLDWQQSCRGLWNAQVYVQPARDAFGNATEYDPRPYSRVAGVNVRYSWDVLSRDRLGLSWQSAHLPQGGGDQVLASIYGGFLTGPVRWSFQVDATEVRGGAVLVTHEHEQGGYVQAVYPLSGHWFIVTQGERFQTRDYPMATIGRLMGVVYRPHPAISWKLDYLDATGAPVGSMTGLYAAWAVLF